MKILHLISQHPESTGSGYYVQNIINQAQRKGHENQLVAGVSDEKWPELPGLEPGACHFATFNREPLDFPIPGMSDVMPYPSSRFSDMTPEQLDRYEHVFGETITEAVRRFSPDIIHSHHLWLVSSVARRLFPLIPMVTSCHSTDLRQFINNRHLHNRVLEPCRKIDRILALYMDQKKQIEDLFGIDEKRIDIVGGGFNRKLFSPLIKKVPPPVQIIYAGKLSFAKGVDWLLKVFRDLDDSDLHLHLAGSGTGVEAQQCLELAAQCGRRITLHGRLNQQKLGELMGRCHFFILPSFFEGLPLVLLEALSTGCRVLTTDLSGCRELLAKADDDLFEIVRLPVMNQIDTPDETDRQELEHSLREAIIKMKEKVIRSPSPGKPIFDAVTHPYGWESIFERIERCYARCLER